MIRKIIFMLLALSILASPALAYEADNYTKIMLHFNGTDQATVTTDDTGREWLMLNNAKLWAADKVEGNASARFASAGNQYMTTTNYTGLVPAKQDFTLEFSMKLSTLNQTYMIFGNDPAASIANVNSSFSLYTGTDGSLKFIMANGTTYKLTTSTGKITDLNWHNYTVMRQKNALYMMQDNVIIGEGDLTGMTSVATANNWSIGRSGTYAGYYMNGLIDDFRYSVGIARYPQAAPKYYAYGDSITYAAAYGLNTTGYDAYVNQLVREHDPTGSAKRSIDGSGMTSNWAVTNFDDHYIPGTQIMFLEFGVNDISTNVPAATCANNIVTMVNWGQANGTRVIPLIQTTMVDKGQNYSSRVLANQQTYIATVQSILDSNNIYYIKLYDTLDANVGNGYPDAPVESNFNATDGVHPTPAGHTLLAAAIWDGLNPTETTEALTIANENPSEDVLIEQNLSGAAVYDGVGFFDSISGSISQGYSFSVLIIIALAGAGILKYLGMV